MLLVAILLIGEVLSMAAAHDENVIKKSYRFVRGYRGPFGRWGKGVWGRKNMQRAMLGPMSAVNRGGNGGNLGGMGGGMNNFGGMGNMGGMGGGMGMFHSEEYSE